MEGEATNHDLYNLLFQDYLNIFKIKTLRINLRPVQGLPSLGVSCIPALCGRWEGKRKPIRRQFTSDDV